MNIPSIVYSNDFEYNRLSDTGKNINAQLEDKNVVFYDDLSGMDVARKLAILAREMGLNIEVKDVEIENLVSQNHSDLSVVDYLKEMVNDDSIMEKRYKQANHDGKVLCYLARLNADGKASVKLEALNKEHPFSRLEGTENIIKYKTRRYSKHPLVHRGPGA